MYCQSLISINADDLTMLGSEAFYNCYSLVSARFNSVTTIPQKAFYACCNLAILEFSGATRVPALNDANALLYIASDCKIKVPAELLDEWKSTTNWSTYKKQIFAI